MKAQAMTPQYDACTQAGPPLDLGVAGFPSGDAPNVLLARISLALTGPLDERLRMERLAHCLVAALGGWCLIELLDEQDQLRLVAVAGETPQQTADARTAWERHALPWERWAPRQQALHEQRPLLLSDDQPSDESPVLGILGCRSGLIIPILIQGQHVGAITLAAPAPGCFGDRSRSWMAEVGRRAATAIENARLYANERAARAEAEAAIRTRDELTALISHDLRNPLAIVHGQAELLLRQLQQPELDQDRLTTGLESIRTAAAQMRLLLDDMQDVARLRAGQPFYLYLEPAELVALARRAVALQQAATPRHALHLEVTQSEVWCLCDVRRLERVLANLLGNAVKYSPAGGPVTLTVGRTTDAEGAWAKLRVADQGIGIPGDDLPHIFAPFYRARNVSGTMRGTGLGLASAHAIIAQHGGRIAVASSEGAGSSFTVLLPLDEGAANA